MSRKMNDLYISGFNVPFRDAREMLLLLHLLFLIRANLGVSVSKGLSLEVVSSSGDGVLMRDTEKRPCTVGVWHAGVPTLLIEGDLPFAGDRLLDFGDCFARVSVLGEEEDLAFGEAFLALDGFFGLSTAPVSGFSCSNS